jgi:ABC-2 type transport system ATP-binding protein
MSEVVARVEHLSKHFGDFTAVDDVSFEVEAGDIVGYLGPNGSGKTTTIRMMLGLIRPSSGRARLMGIDTQQDPEAIRARVGYMSQRFALYDELTAWENLAFYAGVYGIRDPARLEAVLDLLRLVEVRAVRAGELPLGFRQRLALATAIVHAPPLLILDEPTSGVDPMARRAFWDLIYNLAETGVTAFVTTHYMDEAEYCHRVGIMRRGRLLAIDTPSNLKRSALPGRVWDVFGEPLLEALDALARISGVLRSGLAGDHLRALTGPEIALESLQQGLAAGGIQAVRIVSVEPNLEDVFLALASD